MRGRAGVFVGVLAATASIAVAALLPLPAYVIAPGNAVDLSSAVVVGGDRRVSPDTFYLTDVMLMRASPLRLAFALVPGVRIERAENVAPHGISQRSYSAAMTSAMAQSQAIAAIVAERAAGYAIALPPARVTVEDISAASPARGTLAVGDQIERIGGRAVHANDDVRTAVDRLRPGERVRLGFVRAGHGRTATVRTIALGGRTRLGVTLEARYAPPKLAVPVRYALGEVGGSSGGLMMALRIYDALRPGRQRAPRKIAGTGTIGLDGRVGVIDGAQQKLIAAKRAGAHVFLVPRANYREVAAERGLRVIPVGSFAEAVRLLNA